LNNETAMANNNFCQQLANIEEGENTYCFN
jgi:hypothetical protein